MEVNDVPPENARTFIDRALALSQYKLNAGRNGPREFSFRKFALIKSFCESMTRVRHMLTFPEAEIEAQDDPDHDEDTVVGLTDASVSNDWLFEPDDVNNAVADNDDDWNNYVSYEGSILSEEDQAQSTSSVAASVIDYNPDVLSSFSPVDDGYQDSATAATVVTATTATAAPAAAATTAACFSLFDAANSQGCSYDVSSLFPVHSAPAATASDIDSWLSLVDVATFQGYNYDIASLVSAVPADDYRCSASDNVYSAAAVQPRDSFSAASLPGSMSPHTTSVIIDSAVDPGVGSAAAHRTLVRDKKNAGNTSIPGKRKRGFEVDSIKPKKAPKNNRHMPVFVSGRSCFVNTSPNQTAILCNLEKSARRVDGRLIRDDDDEERVKRLLDARYMESWVSLHTANLQDCSSSDVSSSLVSIPSSVAGIESWLSLVDAAYFQGCDYRASSLVSVAPADAPIKPSDSLSGTSLPSSMSATISPHTAAIAVDSAVDSVVGSAAAHQASISDDENARSTSVLGKRKRGFEVDGIKAKKAFKKIRFTSVLDNGRPCLINTSPNQTATLCNLKKSARHANGRLIRDEDESIYDEQYAKRLFDNLYSRAFTQYPF